jgi:hypothetical protein
MVIPSSSFRKELLIAIERAHLETNSFIELVNSHVVIPDGLFGNYD